MVINGTVEGTLVENTRVACVKHGRCRAQRGHHRSSCEGLGLQSMMTDLGLSGQVRVWTLQRGQSDRVKKRVWKDETYRVELRLTQEVTKIWKSEDEAGPRRTTCGGPLDEGNIVGRDSCGSARS